ncbi:branched-chain amino acid transport system II carrier protein [Trueperella pecoris]|uniref:Branched-chain amino acid transport system II carrier protein n=1 Tax=Trueperella pecoris TaxID=2733571 RepID=A0A7M1QWR2_9ACTO|nr:branched-chain amino acid transport system II carrier protein [Trueperella pecoris]QOQ39787.1 branched-chain amino acid transport system II carrier protein [Trueperella pecoris]QOR45587.1 branched-chain amino acid transport system II carrier protein [Trueperella pecoris]QTG75429.1 branched-chain amino acid transport system II carrier protein [Trueperella pecoris]
MNATRPSTRHVPTVIVGFALFAMFFGAGNLIFPVMIGADSAGHVVPVFIGFLLTGVALPILTMIVISTETAREINEGGVAMRIGRVAGFLFTLAIFLSTGMLYAVPRVATVAYEMSTRPFVETDTNGSTALFVFTLIFFAVVTMFLLNPARVIGRVGGILTPLLLGFLALLVVVAVVRLPALVSADPAVAASSTLTAGIIKGYYTMDALGAFVFGIVVVSELKKLGAATRAARINGMVKAGLVAGACLALVYVGLAAVGVRQANAGFTNGAELLASVSGQMFGGLGQVIFGAITLLACLTTVIGLMTSSTEYFTRLLRVVPRTVIIGVQIVVSIVLANLGLERILEFVAPLNQFIYPIAIVIVLLGLLELGLPFRLDWTYKLGALVAAVVAFVEAGMIGAPERFAALAPAIEAMPFADLKMAWTVPALVAIVVGFMVDASRRAAKRS